MARGDIFRENEQMATKRIKLGILFFGILGFGGITMVPAQESGGLESIAAPGARLQKLAEDFEFTEGPTPDRDGNVYFTDQPNDRIMRWDVGGEISTFLQPAGRSNGLYFTPDGNLLACADEKNQLWEISPEGEATVLVHDFEGRLLNGPNDVWVRPDGGIYFTDPFYERPYWSRGGMEIDIQGVYFLTPDRSRLTRVIDDLEKPNGIVGTADGRRLYVADIRGRKTWSYEILPDGQLANKQLFCEMGSDGMTLDSEGNLYLTGQGVTIFNSQGEQLAHIDVPERWTANVCFGGSDGRTLFITASKSVYALEMRVKGADR